MSLKPLQVLILATGFRTLDYLEPLQIFNHEGLEISKMWKEEGPSVYLGITTHRFPNLFVVLGPCAVRFKKHSKVISFMNFQSLSAVYIFCNETYLCELDMQCFHKAGIK